MTKTNKIAVHPAKTLSPQNRWLDWAMVLGSFQCRGVLLLLHIVGQGPAVLAADVRWMGYIFYIFHLSALSDVLPFWRRLNMTEILWFWLLNPNGSCQLHPRLVLVNRLEDLSLPKNSAIINWPAQHDLVVDWAVKLQPKQSKVHPVRSETLLCALRIAKDPVIFMRTGKTDQIGQMPRLIRVFAGWTCNFVGFVMRRLIYFFWGEVFPFEVSMWSVSCLVFIFKYF